MAHNKRWSVLASDVNDGDDITVTPSWLQVNQRNQGLDGGMAA